MSEASFASLGPTLLARKGGAKPAMRPQLAPLPEDMSEMAALADEQLEDLGWNDMGAEDDLLVSTAPSTGGQHENAHPILDPLGGADIVSLEQRRMRPAPANEDSLDAASPVVLRQQKRLARRILADAALEGPSDFSSETTPVKQRKQAKAKKQKVSVSAKAKRRAAFTLRLDAERHLKLRLAATMQNVSAQALVTEALDSMLAEIKELDTLVQRMQRD